MENNSLKYLSDILLEKIHERSNPFDPFVVIVPSLKVEQYFKAYWLKNTNDILMNVTFKRLDSFLFESLNNDNRYSLLDKDTIKYLIIKNLSNKEISFDDDIIKKYLDESDAQYLIKLYDVADKLSSLFIEYDKDLVELTGFQKALYNKITSFSFVYSKDEVEYEKKYTTLRKLFEDNKEEIELDYPIYLFGFVELTKLQESVLELFKEQDDKIIRLFLKEDEVNVENITLTSAPSKLREIESIHSTICDIIEKEKDTKYSDFLVLANDMSEYKTTIARVFNQDNKQFVNIPYSVICSTNEESNISLGLKKIVDILNKGFYSRKDLFELLSNKDIQQARNIEDSKVRDLVDSVICMNAYRNRFEVEEFEYIKKRLLLSKLVGVDDEDNIISLKDNKYLPYSSISMDNKEIIDLVKIIDDLKSLNDLYKSIDTTNKDKIELFKNELDKWFSFSINEAYETNKDYKSIINTLYSWINLDIECPKEILLFSLLDVASSSKYNSGFYFTSGVTFTSFDINSILEAKYVFFLNASSNNLPKRIVKSELDLRDTITNDKEKKAFEIQANNANHFYVSYVNKNLATDEDFYPSSYIKDLFNGKQLNEIKMPLDETRSWNQLYTRREYKNKNYYSKLLENKKENDRVFIIDGEYKNPIESDVKNVKITTTQMANYLIEPLKYKATVEFGGNDFFEQWINEEYEYFELTPLQKSLIIKEMIKEQLVDGKTNFKEFLKAKKELPDINDTILDCELSEIENDVYGAIDLINSYPNCKINIVQNNDIEFKNGILISDKEIIRVDNENEIHFFEFKKNENETNKYKDNLDKVIGAYVLALACIANDNIETKDIFIHRNREKMVCKFSVSSKDAYQILNSIFDEMSENKTRLLPIRLLFKKSIKSLYDLVNNVMYEHQPWEYFDDKHMFDIDDQLGYTYQSFDLDFERAKEKLCRHLAFLNDEELEENEDGEK